MGIYFSNSSIVQFGATYANNDTFAAQFLTDMNTVLFNAGWTSKSILAEISFSALSLAEGVIFQPGNFIIWNPASGPPPVGYSPITMASTTYGTLSNLILPFAQAIGGQSGGITIVDGLATMNIIDIPFNNVATSVFPTGSAGLWSYTGTTAGTGLTYGAGFQWTSAPVNGISLILSGTKNPAPSITIEEMASGTQYNALDLGNQFQFLANKYQVFITAIGSFASGTFFVGGALQPLGDLTNFNYTNGPTISDGGGERDKGFTSISFTNPVINGSNVNSADIAFQIPATVGGIAELQLVYDKRDATLDQFQGLLYDAMLAYAPSGIGGAFWDSIITSIAPTLDTNASLFIYNNNIFTVILSSDGVNQANGALLVLKDTYSNSAPAGQLDSSVIGNVGGFSLKGPSSFITTLNPTTGQVPSSETTEGGGDYAF